MALLHGAHAHNPTLVLPHALMRDILSRLPADQRARVACVCVSWRTAVADPQLWARLDLSAQSGVTCRVDDDALRTAAARARGGLVALIVTWREEWLAELRAVAAANAASLRELRLFPPPNIASASVDELQALLAAAPALQVLEADVVCSIAAARRLLRNEPPFGPLRLRRIRIEVGPAGVSFRALAADLVAHPSLSDLTLYDTHGFVPLMPDEMNAVVDAALALRLTSLQFYTFRMPPAAAPALIRVLSSAALTRLLVINMDYDPPDVLLDAPTAALLSAALRANSTLLSLRLCDVGLLDDAAVATAVLGALTGHASIRSLDFSYNRVLNVAARPAIGAALGALVAADAPALTELDISRCYLDDAALGLLVGVLPRNTHLRKLVLDVHCISADFAAQRLLPAVLANRSLREFRACQGEEDEPVAAVRAVMQFVAAREAARVAEEAVMAFMPAGAAAAGSA